MKSSRSNCNCCGMSRVHPIARWERCLQFNSPSCPVYMLSKNNVLAPLPAQHSAKIRNSKLIKYGANNSTGRWRKVNWRRFKLEQQTNEYQTRIITNSSNNPTERVVRNGRIINIKPTLENPCGEFTPDDTKANIPAKLVSNCCQTSLSNKTWGEIAQMTPEQMAEYSGPIQISCLEYPKPPSSDTGTGPPREVITINHITSSFCERPALVNCNGRK